MNLFWIGNLNSCITLNIKHIHNPSAQVFNLPSNALYKVYKPLRYGRLNVEGGLSRMTVLKQLEDLWCRAIEECLDIPRKDFKVMWYPETLLIFISVLYTTLIFSFKNIMHLVCGVLFSTVYGIMSCSPVLVSDCDSITKFYRVILLVPDVVDRLLYRDLMNILLLQLQFEAAIIHQVFVFYSKCWCNVSNLS